jgi:hypothetical protein
MCIPSLSKRFVIGCVFLLFGFVGVLVWMSLSGLHSFGSMYICGKFVICGMNLVSLCCVW